MSTRVEPGALVFLRRYRDFLRGRRYGLVCNVASVLPDGTHLLSALFEAGKDVAPRVLFVPEHGMSYARQYMEPVDSSVHPRWRIPVISLYGDDLASLAPPANVLADLDLLVFDLQDIGTRYYTYLATMAMCLEAACSAGIPFLVLDRPNPLGLEVREGNVVEEPMRSFVGYLPLRNRHGVTAGEAARVWARRKGIEELVSVVPCSGLRRDTPWSDTGLPFVPPSPNMPDLDTAYMYTGMCLLEGTNVSEGRGTAMPFKVCGAPWVDDPDGLAADLNVAGLRGVKFLPVAFVPSADKYAGYECRGVLATLTDRRHFHSLLCGLVVVHAFVRRYREYVEARATPYEFSSEVPALDLLLGHRGAGEALLGGEDPRVLLAELERDLGEHEDELARAQMYPAS